MKSSRVVAVLAIGALLVGACAGSDEAGGGTTSTSQETGTSEPADEPVADATVPASSMTEPAHTEPVAEDPVDADPRATGVPATEPPLAESDPMVDPAGLVSLLASDEMNGRNNESEGSAASRDLLVSLLSIVAAPAVPDGSGGLGFLQEYDVGTNIVGVIAGTGELANEYVMIGAHYDHLGPGECDTRGETDDEICNGAADNAAGVASVMTVVDRLQNDADEVADDSGRRGIIVALWDGEEDGLIGSRRYVEEPVVPLEQTVAYVNFDIQGASLLPAMSNNTVLVGPETGGAPLVEAAARATEASPLDYATFSLVFGQGRSDHAVLVEAGVPSVFFTDANNGCYHTVLDDVDHYEPEKHLQQIDTAESFTRDLLTSERPSFVADASTSTHSDAEQLASLVAAGVDDLDLLPDGGVAATTFMDALDDIVRAGPEAYDDAAAAVVLGGAAQLVGDLADGECRLP